MASTWRSARRSAMGTRTGCCRPACAPRRGRRPPGRGAGPGAALRLHPPGGHGPHPSGQVDLVPRRQADLTDRGAVETAATPPPKPDPAKTPIEGWKPRRLPGGEWGAVLTGSHVAELPDNGQLPRTPIVVTDNKGDAWTTTLVGVVSRTDGTIVVRIAGRPRD